MQRAGEPVRWVLPRHPDRCAHGHRATGKQVTVSGVTISRLGDGKLVEEFHSWDTFGLMQQINAIPAIALA